MYQMPNYIEKDSAAVLAFMKQHSFITLAGVDNNHQPVITQIPVLIEEREGVMYLRGHFMRNTAHHKAFEHNRQALAVFTGPHTYVSASWYTDKQQASTWNYMAVQARGVLHFLGENELVQLLRDLTAFYENNSNSPSLYEHLPQVYTSRLLKAIVAFEIEVKEINNTFKLSQNRDKESFEQIIIRLEQGDADAQAIAAEMRKRKDTLFPE